MDESDKQTPSSPLQPWPKCQEPYQTRIAQMSSAWLSSEMSHERLALELIKQTALARHVGRQAPGMRKIPMDDVFSQIAILTDAMLAAIELETEALPALRQEALDFNRGRKRPKGHPGLP